MNGITENEKPLISIEIDRIRVMTDPEYHVFNVDVATNTGTWRETLGSEADLRIFLRGVQAGAAALGVHVPSPEIPREENVVYEERIVY